MTRRAANPNGVCVECGAPASHFAHYGHGSGPFSTTRVCPRHATFAHDEEGARVQLIEDSYDDRPNRGRQ